MFLTVTAWEEQERKEKRSRSDVGDDSSEPKKKKSRRQSLGEAEESPELVEQASKSANSHWNFAQEDEESGPETSGSQVRVVLVVIDHLLGFSKEYTQVKSNSEEINGNPEEKSKRRKREGKRSCGQRNRSPRRRIEVRESFGPQWGYFRK